MLSLHQVTDETKAVLKWSGIIIGLIFLITTFYRIGKQVLFPPKPPPPTVSFGKLPQETFPKSATTNPLTYSLNTLSGKLPVFPDRMAVFKIEQPIPTLLALQTVQDKMERLGFEASSSAISDTLYHWSDNTSLAREMFYDIVSNNFNMTSNYLYNPDVLEARSLPNEGGSVEAAQSFLVGLSSIPTDVDTGKIKTSMFTINGQSLIPATSLSTATVIRVDYYQRDVNGLPLQYPHPPFSPMNVTVGATGKHDPFRDGKVVAANFFHQNISSVSATYPIKTAEEAFTELKEEKGYIASFNGTKNDVSIKNVYLAYYMDEKQQGLLTPVIVFSGDNDFYAYIPAIRDEWVQK